MEAQAAPAPQPAPFPEIPGYRIEAVIGRGSTGVVYRATQLAVERKVALKVLHPELTGRVRAVRRLQREARTAAKLGHPGIVTAIDMGNAGGRWWYAMELVDGPSLAERLKEHGALTEREALKLFVPLCEALEHAFEHRVVHRDIKPGNILIDAGGRARIVDLGLAFTEEDPALTMPGGTLGTPHYIAPEQARNPKLADVRSDIWSLGATLFHAVCGRPPFTGESVAEILSGVLYARIPDPGSLAPDLSKGLRLVLRKCLARDPDRRYQSPRELREDLERILERRQVQVKRAALDPVLGQMARRRKLAIAGATAGALALAAAGVWWAQSHGGGGASPSAEARFEPLEQIAADARGATARLAMSLSALEDLRDELPPEFEARWREVVGDVRRRWGDALAESRARFQRDLASRRKERDLVGALALIDAELVPALRTELNPSPAQLAQIRGEWSLDRQREEVEAEIEDALAKLERAALAHFNSRHVAPANAREEAHEWNAAREALRASAEAIVAECGVPSRGLPAQRVAALAGELAQRATQARAELDERWRAYDARLAVEIATAANELALAVDERRVARACDALRVAWTALCAKEGLKEGELLDDVSDAARRTLELRCRDLEQREAEAKLVDARRLLASWRERLDPLWARRGYRELASEWSRAATLDYFAPLAREIDLERREAELLQGLLARAAAGLRAAAANAGIVELQVGAIRRVGRYEIGGDPLTDAFRLIPTDAAAGSAPIPLVLSDAGGGAATLLARDEVERRAGLAVRGATPADALALALFRSREGDLKGARELLPLPTPPELDLQALADVATARIQGAIAAQDARTGRRTEEARDLLRLIKRVGLGGAVDARTELQHIDRLLTEYGDLELVRSAGDELRARRAELVAPPKPPSRQDLIDLFGPDSAVVNGSQAAMRFGFDGAAQGAWKSGDWSFDGDGWQARDARTREDLFDESRWPRLVLRAPVALDAAMDVEIDLEQLRDSGPPQLFVATVAGVHVAFFGGAPETGEPPRFLVDSGGPDRLRTAIDDLLAARRGTPFGGLQRGERHTVRIELSQGRGAVAVFLDGRKLEQGATKRPGLEEIGDESIVVRSLEPVRLREVRFEGRVR